MNIAMQGGATPFFIASQSGHLEVVCLLPHARADRDIAMQGGATPLFIAPQSGHPEPLNHISTFPKGLHLRMNCWAGFCKGVNTEKVGFGGLSIYIYIYIYVPYLSIYLYIYIYIHIADG